MLLNSVYFSDGHEVDSASVADVLHLPGLRGTPERFYGVTRVGHHFPGPFTPHAASVLVSWQEKHDPRTHLVGQDLQTLGLTWKVDAKRLDDSRVQLKVGRLPKPNGSNDLVDIADVGFGASQVLPVVVALHAAAPGQLLHIEQPELHLHPNAQVAMASLLAAAAKRGVQVVVETHSAVMLKALQLLIATDQLDEGLVALHWFERDEAGATKVTTAKLDDHGVYGDWPVDFADVELDVEARFIDAATK